jgi:hypothetical protein
MSLTVKKYTFSIFFFIFFQKNIFLFIYFGRHKKMDTEEYNFFKVYIYYIFQFFFSKIKNIFSVHVNVV